MSNQRVIVLTDEEIDALRFPHAPLRFRRSAVRKLEAALEHPEGITEDVNLSAAGKALRGIYPNQFADDFYFEQQAKGVLEAALFSGEGEL